MNDLTAAPPLLIRGGLVYDSGRPDRPRAADVHLRDGRIREISPPSPADQPAPDDVDVLDATGHLVMPGLINAHYHSHDTLLKGAFEPTYLESWMMRALPARYGPRPLDEIYARTLIGAVDCLRSGITTVQDMLSLSPMSPEALDVVEQAYSDAGIRVVLAPQLADIPILDALPNLGEVLPDHLRDRLRAAAHSPAASTDLSAAELVDLIVQRSGQSGQSRLTWALAASGPERCSRDLIELLLEGTRRLGSQFFAHAAISRADWVAANQRLGGSAIQWLDEIGALGTRSTLAHCVWADEHDVRTLASSRTRVVVNPVSNLKTKNGVAPLLSMYRHGVTVALGCDNTSCGDAQNLFPVMKMYALLTAAQDVLRDGPPAHHALEAALLGGAKALGMEGLIGTLQPGSRADLVLVDLSDPAYLPLNHVGRQVVLSETGRAVRHVLVDGWVRVRDAELTRFGRGELEELVDKIWRRFSHDVQAVTTDAAGLQQYVDAAEEMNWHGSAPRLRF